MGIEVTKIEITVIVSMFNCTKFLEGFFDALLKIENNDEVLYLFLHNEPSVRELDIINCFLPFIPHYKHIQIPERESLYQTWNRGCKLASSEFLTVWNVDDIRYPDSLINQRNALQRTPTAVMCYGNMHGTDVYGEKLIQRNFLSPIWSNENFEFKESHHIGCFQMWRKSLHNTIGYYDELFLIVSDYEFQLRLTNSNLEMVKCDGFLGLYLENQPHKLSSQTLLQAFERTAVELRYGLYHKTNLLYRKRIVKSYNIKEILNFGLKIPIEKLVPNYLELIKKRNTFTANALGLVHTINIEIRKLGKKILLSK